MTVIHDVVLGDFGRLGTLRYLEAFEEAERRLILSRLPAGTEFFDEYRLVRYTVIGALREVKAALLPDRGALSRSVLIGTRDGPSPETLYGPVLRVLMPFVVNARERGASVVRIVVPCNTLSLLCSNLEETLADFATFARAARLHQIDSDDITAMADWLVPGRVRCPAVPSVVLGELQARQVRTVAVVASDEAFRAYEEASARRPGGVEVTRWSSADGRSFEDCLLRAVESGSREASDLSGAETSATVLSGCTDVRIAGALDSTEIFAQAMAVGAYDFIGGAGFVV